MAVSLQQFVENLTRSGLMTADEVSSFQQGRPAEKQPKDAQTLAQALVQAGKLTKYQAQMIYQGRPKGLVFGEYTVLDKLGQGGMGVVLKAQHRRMKRMVAVKVLPASSMKSSEAVKRFYREVEAAAKLNHPNVVQAYDASEHEGIHYLVMEYVEGDTLSAVVKQRGPLEVPQALDCILQAAKGLAYAHREGVIHRDIKPGNLLLDKEGTVKILDMGLARMALAVGGDGPDDERLTQSGQVMGTCDYMAPEQAEDTRKADQRSDIYSLGCTLYRLLTGKALYSGDSLVSILLAHQNAPIPSLQAARPEIPADVAAIFEKMVAKRPEDRYPSMAAVIAAVEAFLGGTKRPPVRVLAPEPPSEFLPQSLAFLREPPPMPATQQRRATVAKAAAAAPAVHEDTLRPSMHDDTGTGLVGQMKRAVTSVRRIPTPLLAVAGGTAALVVFVGLVLTIAGKGGGEGEREGTRSTASDSPHPSPLPKGEGTVAPTADVNRTTGEFPGLPQTSEPEEGGTKKGVPARNKLPIGQWIPVLTSQEGYTKWSSEPLNSVYKSGLEESYADGLLTLSGSGGLCYPWEVQDAAIRAKVKKGPGLNLALLLRCGEGSFYGAWFNGGDWFGIGTLPEGGAYRDLKTVRLGQSYDDFFEFEFSAIGERLTASVNGSVIMEVNDSTLRHGLAGVGVSQGTGHFKDIELKVLKANEDNGHGAGGATSRNESTGKTGPGTRATNDYDSLATGKWIDVLNSPEAVAKAHVLPMGKTSADAEAESGARWVDGEVQVTEHVALLDHPVKDCLIRAKVRKVSAHSVGLMLHYGDKNMHNVFFDCTAPGEGWGGIGRAVSEDYQFLWRSSPDTPVPQPQEGYLEIAFAAVGDSLSTFVNGKAFGEAHDETHRAGIPYVYAYSPEKPRLAVFKDIQIQVLDRDAASGDAAASAAHSANGSEPKGRNSLPQGEGTAPPPAIAPFDAATARKHQEAWAKHLGVPVEFANSIGMKFVLIPPGEFMMGISAEEVQRLVEEQKRLGKPEQFLRFLRSSSPRHRVKLRRPFCLGAHEVTVGSFRAFVNESGYRTDAEKDGRGGFGFDENEGWTRKPEFTWRDPGYAQTDSHPVVNVTWSDAVAFCQWLGAKESKRFHLPTEAQWEYACRAGTETPWSCGSEQACLKDVANLADASALKKGAHHPKTATVPWDDKYPFTAPIGSFRPNAFGLFDMHGNVFEWCADWHDPAYYSRSPLEDPQGPELGPDGVLLGCQGEYAGPVRALRGGGFFYDAAYCQSACRVAYVPGDRNNYRGFRVSCSF